jgi:hypothetical protein
MKIILENEKSRLEDERLKELDEYPELTDEAKDL